MLFMKKNIKIISLISWTVLLILIVALIMYKNDYFISFGSHIYKNPTLNLIIKYPQTLRVKESYFGKNEEKITIITFSNNKRSILLVPLIRNNTDVSNEKKFYEGFLFKDPNQNNNSHVSIGEFDGFKAIVDYETVRYTVYKPTSDEETLILRSEITASTTNNLNIAEHEFIDILRGVNISSTTKK